LQGKTSEAAAVEIQGVRPGQPQKAVAMRVPGLKTETASRRNAGSEKTGTRKTGTAKAATPPLKLTSGQ
jgi:hypothetical protein